MESVARANFGISRSEPDLPSLRTPPHNFEAEMALLGALLANNKAFDKVVEFLKPEHFADARHGRIYDACAKLIQRGTIANPVTLKNYFEQDDSLAEIGGTQYLARLVGAVVRELDPGGGAEAGRVGRKVVTVNDRRRRCPHEQEGEQGRQTAGRPEEASRAHERPSFPGWKRAASPAAASRVVGTAG